ncbi:MAG TPA: serine/threonine-protein kinase [Vicinamibacterales bacterium]|nr:serine/threonine-protein kinase [Vicinamibacterales bacterium]
MTLDHVRPPPAAANSSDDDARAFLQERLAYLGRIYASIGLTFYIVGNIAGLIGLPHDLGRRLSDPSTWVVPAASTVYLMQWVLCRRGAVALPRLRVIDGTTTILAAVFHSLMVFTTIPGEAAGMPYTRALLLVNFGLIVRAIVVPSSAARTLTYGVAAAALSTVTCLIGYANQPAALPSGLHAVWTAMWSLGGGVIATLASHVIFGLRREIREARRLGQYTLLEKIGEGGMGSVYRARHAMLRRPTAIKLLPADRAGAERIQRFEREVQLTSQLTHPNTISIFDYGRTPDGVFYYAMEYLDGLNLEDLVRIDGPQPPGRVQHILRQVAGSLSEAHDFGVVHRDIKPSNVILVAERGGAPDVAKVVDFGLIKDLDETAWRTQEGRVFGTPHYLSPEAISSGEPVGPSSDLYSLGCVGYFLLTGQRVFEGQTVIEVCTQHLKSEPVRPADRLGRPLPESLSAILMACLEKTADRRPPSARALIALLDDCHDVEPWTREQSRLWWNFRGRRVLAESRHPDASVQPDSHDTHTHTLVAAS